MRIYQPKNIDCASCVAKIEEGVAKLKLVKFVSVSFANSSMMFVTLEPTIFVIFLRLGILATDKLSSKKLLKTENKFQQQKETSYAS
ncbi:MAG: cation transporter [Stygiobacter sp.]